MKETTEYLQIPLECLSMAEATHLVQYALILRAMKTAKGNKTHAAALLKMNRTTLVEMIKRLSKVCDGRLL